MTSILTVSVSLVFTNVFLFLQELLLLQAFTNCVRGYNHAHNVHTKGITPA